MKQTSPWTWIWPAVGPTPISEGLDSEVFDRSKFPYSETFVREALQNSLDARIDSSPYVRVAFQFHQADLPPNRSLLDEVISMRNRCGLFIPEDWHNNICKWLVVQDYDATGLSGDLKRRTSDFWNYWLNFGQSNKDGSGRGGRGIGRVTFLIASKIQTVIGYTRRFADNNTSICGMAVLKSIEDGTKFRSTHAYLAKSVSDSIYNLHNGDDIHEAVTQGLKFDDYAKSSNTGLALAVPYPHEELNQESILAAAIENFAPTIIDGTLKVSVDGKTLEGGSIESIAQQFVTNFSDKAIREDPTRYLSLIKSATIDRKADVVIDTSESTKRITFHTYRLKNREILRQIEDHGHCLIDVSIPIRIDGKTHQGCIRGIIGKSPEGAEPLDRFFRDGMCLPEVRARNVGEFDILLFSGDDLLARYLNLCEGRAHLDLSRSKAVTEKLRSYKFDAPVYRIRDLIKQMSHDLRQLLYGDETEPDSKLFESFFSVPSGSPTKKEPSTWKPTEPSVPSGRDSTPFKWKPTKRGIRVASVMSHKDWPVDLFATISYSDGRPMPRWDELDFMLKDLGLKFTKDKCKCVTLKGNTLEAIRCEDGFKLEIDGFDSNRELVVSWSTRSHAHRN